MAILHDISVLHEAPSTPITLDSMSRDITAELENTSYFAQTVDFLIEYNQEYNSAVKTLYRSILESAGDQVVITESFEGFKTTVKKIIDKFLAFIKMIFQRFITNINSLVKAEGYLKHHEKDFRKFSTQHEFDFSGYEFTIENNIPESNAEAEWIDSVDVAFTTYANILADDKYGSDLAARQKSAEVEIKKNYQALVDRLNGTYYDELRARIIGQEGKQITDSEFANELFSVFRNGSSDKDEITVDSSYVISTFARFKDYDHLKKSIEKNRNSIETSYKNIRKELDKMIDLSGSSSDNTLGATLGPKTDAYIVKNGYGTGVTIAAGEMTQTMANLLEQYKKAKINQVQQMSNIHALAFGAKLDAAKDMFNQDKAVLYKALYKIQGMPKDNK